MKDFTPYVLGSLKWAVVAALLTLNAAAALTPQIVTSPCCYRRQLDEGCFPGSSLVRVRGQGQVPLRELQLGQEVRTADPDGSLHYRKVGCNRWMNCWGGWMADCIAAVVPVCFLVMRYLPRDSCRFSCARNTCLRPGGRTSRPRFCV